MALVGKHILLVISGGIAAYKSLEVIRGIQKAGGTVQVILTENAKQFVTPLTVSALTKKPALSELFDLTQETEIGHIELSRSADLIVIAPATANLMAKMAHGIADDLASTCLLATDTDILVSPAMNVRMWEAKPTQRNMLQLAQDGVRFIGPNAGEMACGEFGPGRMAEPDEILRAIDDYFAGGILQARNEHRQDLAGRVVIVTSGPTREAIDPVRYISNASSGLQGTAIADALIKRGAHVKFITGPAEAARPLGADIVEVMTALEMDAAVNAALPADAAIFCAAVADWRVANPAQDKIKKDKNQTLPTIEFAENPDILKRVSHLPLDERPKLVVGFAAETGGLLDKAQAKFERKGCDWIFANDVSPQNNVFGGSATHIFKISKAGVEDWGGMSKQQVGEKIAEQLAVVLKE